MALYTLCYIVRPNQTCPVLYERDHFQIRTAVSEDNELRSAFFEF